MRHLIDATACKGPFWSAKALRDARRFNDLAWFPAAQGSGAIFA